MIEVIKQMVEALEWSHGGEPIGTADAITAGKQLIAELESQEPVATFDEVWDSIEWDKWRMEPIRELVKMIHSKTTPPQRTELKIKTTDPFESARVGDYNRGWNDCLFASGIVKQTQHTWIGLTEQQRNDIENDFEAFISIHVFDAIEAKLKERNGYSI